jgi:hypothetical protein
MRWCNEYSLNLSIIASTSIHIQQVTEERNEKVNRGFDLCIRLQKRTSATVLLVLLIGS